MITLLDDKPVGKGTLQGYAKLLVIKWGLEIHGITHFKDGEKEWCNLPKKDYKDKNGDTKYNTVIKFVKSDHEAALMKMVKESIQQKTNTMPTSASLSDDQMEMPF